MSGVSPDQVREGGLYGVQQRLGEHGDERVDEGQREHESSDELTTVGDEGRGRGFDQDFSFQQHRLPRIHYHIGS